MGKSKEPKLALGDCALEEFIFTGGLMGYCNAMIFSTISRLIL